MILSDPVNNFSQWDEFVFNHPHGNIFQSSLMYRIYSKSRFYTPVLLISKDNSDRINGILLATIIKEGTYLKGVLSRRSIIQKGPLVSGDNPEILESLLSNYQKIIKSRAIYTQYRNGWHWGELVGIFQKYNYEYESHLDIIHDLGQDEEILWKNLDYSKRKNINNAVRNGLIIKEVDLNAELENVYNILKSVYSKAKLPLFEYEFLNLVKNNLDDKLVCIGAYKENLLVGFRLLLCFKDLVYDWYAGSLTEYLYLRPNDILPWEVMKWAKSNNYKYFDFGGAGKPDKPYGVRDYKIKFGGELVNYGRFQVVHNKLLMAIGIAGMTLYKKANGIRKRFVL